MLAWLLERAEAQSSAGRDRGTLSQIERARAQVELELAELRLAEFRGLVIRVDDALEIMGADYDLIRKALRSVPARIGPDLWFKLTAGGSESDCVEALERTVDGILETLSGERFGRGNGNTAPASVDAGGNGKAAKRPQRRAKRKTATVAAADGQPMGQPKLPAKRRSKRGAGRGHPTHHLLHGRRADTLDSADAPHDARV